jgi:hypothetical protein
VRQSEGWNQMTIFFSFMLESIKSIEFVIQNHWLKCEFFNQVFVTERSHLAICRWKFTIFMRSTRRSSFNFEISSFQNAPRVSSFHSFLDLISALNNINVHWVSQSTLTFWLLIRVQINISDKRHPRQSSLVRSILPNFGNLTISWSGDKTPNDNW